MARPSTDILPEKLRAHYIRYPAEKLDQVATNLETFLDTVKILQEIEQHWEHWQGHEIDSITSSIPTELAGLQQILNWFEEVN